MILYVDSESKVRAVNSTTDASLTPLYVDENNDSFPFKGWSIAKICCYKVSVSDGVVTMMTPYVPSSELSYVDTLGKMIDKLNEKLSVVDGAVSDIGEAVSGIADHDETQDGAIEDLAQAVSDLTPEEE